MSKFGNPTLDVGCEFGGVSIGDETARIGLTIDRNKVPLEKADQFFSGARLEGEIVLGTSEDVAGQGRLIDAHSRIQSVFDSKRFSVGAKEFSTGFTFPLSEIDVKDLAGFAKRSGRISVTRVGDLGDDGEDDDERESGSGGIGLFPHPDVEAGKDRPVGAPAMTEAAKEFKRRKGDKGYSFGVDILTRKKLKALARENGRDTDSGITESKCELIVEALSVKTVAALEKVIATNPFWHRDVKGCGETVIDQLTEAVFTFRQIYPVPSDEDVEEPAKEETAAKEDSPKTEDNDPGAENREAYKKGCEASIAGTNKNPYKAGSELARHWIDGWTDTEKAGNKKPKKAAAAKPGDGKSGTMLSDENTEEVSDEETGADEE